MIVRVADFGGGGAALPWRRQSRPSPPLPLTLARPAQRGEKDFTPGLLDECRPSTGSFDLELCCALVIGNAVLVLLA